MVILTSDKMNFKQLEFGNDKSRLLRGIAIIFMVTNHTLPGMVIAFAVSLFSFLVGYGYAFAKERNLRHGYRRVKHLLGEYWVIFLGICLPAALLYYPFKITGINVVYGMFGLDPKLNFYSWYVYFYIFAMAVMPVVSRVIDRYGWRGAAGIMLLCVGLYYAGDWWRIHYPSRIENVPCRCFANFPVIVAGYWMARYKVFSKVRVPDVWWVAPLALVAMVGVYFARGSEISRFFDFAWAPIFAGLMTVALSPGWLAPVRKILTLGGIQSGRIWFLHGLFMTHATKVAFGRLVDWIKLPFFKVVAILLISYLFAVIIAKLTELFIKYTSPIPAALRRGISNFRLTER